MNPVRVARAQGVFNVASGAWPLLDLRGFERVFGPRRMKAEQDWLVRTVSGLLVSTGWSQLASCSAPACLVQARRAGLGTALTLLAVDVVYVPAGQARRSHLLDALVEAGWLLAWWRAGRLTRTGTRYEGGLATGG
ncbi:hypothetical protein [Streptomyces sp. 8N706]|uniref:hypothetical protein n=1 Tax=Streptomyces sp. 8N706 TaxID=3457416 RepID=UPI003FD5711C